MSRIVNLAIANVWPEFECKKSSCNRNREFRSPYFVKVDQIHVFELTYFN